MTEDLDSRGHDPGGSTPAKAPDIGRARLGFTQPLTVTLFDGFIEGTGGRGGTFWLVDTAGRRPDRLVGTIPETGATPWRLHLEDPTGATLFPSAGDGILVQQDGEGDQPQDPGRAPELAVLPFVDLVFDRDAGRIGGRAVPGLLSHVDISIAPGPADKASLPGADGGAGVDTGGSAGADPNSGGGAKGLRRATAEVAEDGSFGLDLAAGGPLDGGQALTLTLRTPQNLTTIVNRRVPYTRVSLHPGDVIGAGAPLSPVTVTLRTAEGTWRGQGQGLADARGDFRTWILDNAGERVRPMIGDEVTVEAGDSPWTLKLPELTGGPDGQVLAGAGMPGARLELTVWNPWRPGVYARPTTTIGTDGTWRVDPGMPIEPAMHYYLTEHVGAGDLLFYCQQLPRLHLEPGTPRLRVEALADITADLRLLRDGREVAAATGTDLWSGHLALGFADSGGLPVNVLPDDRITGMLSGETIDLIVPPFEAALDPAATRIRGQASPGVTVTLAMPVPNIESAQRASGDGSFELQIPAEEVATGGPAPGAEITAYTELPAKHNAGRRFLGPSLTIDLDSGRMSGEAEPGAQVRWLEGDQEVASQVSVTGTLETALPTTAKPGQIYTLRVDETPLPFHVPDLSLNFDPRTGIASGSGPAGEALELVVFRGRYSPGDALAATVGSDGRWSVDLRGEPGRLHRIDPSAVRRLALRWYADPGVVYQRQWERSTDG